jgi:sphingomyelin phosphodiesterase
MYDLFKRTLGSGPVYAALGNHDSYNQYVSLEITKQLLTRCRAQDAPHALGGALAEQFSWSASHIRLLWASIGDIFFRNYDHVSGLWKLEHWLPQTSLAQARAHYAAYSVQRTDGLRVISLNADMCKRPAFLGQNELTQGV